MPKPTALLLATCLAGVAYPAMSQGLGFAVPGVTSVGVNVGSGINVGGAVAAPVVGNVGVSAGSGGVNAGVGGVNAGIGGGLVGGTVGAGPGGVSGGVGGVSASIGGGGIGAGVSGAGIGASAGTAGVAVGGGPAAGAAGAFGGGASASSVATASISGDAGTIDSFRWSERFRTGEAPLPASLAPCGNRKRYSAVIAGVGEVAACETDIAQLSVPLVPKPGTPQAVVNGCRGALTTAALKYRVARVDAASAGAMVRTGGGYAAPIEFRVIYRQRQGGLEAHRSVVQCRMASNGTVVAMKD
jgi:hypothetical protein